MNAFVALASSFLVFFPGGGKQDIVQNQPEAGRVWVEVQIRWRISNKVAVILGIVAAVKGPKPVAISPVDVARLLRWLVLAHDEHV